MTERIDRTLLDDLSLWGRVIASNASQIGPLTGGPEKRRQAILDRAQRIGERLEAVEVLPPVVEPDPDPDPDPPPPDPDDDLEFMPPERFHRVDDAPSGTTVKTNTLYVNPQGSLNFPAGIEAVTVIGARAFPTTIIRGWRDVHIEGHPDRWMTSGPRSDGGDLLQIKSTEAGGTPPEDVTIRYWHGRDVTRPAGKHSDGVQIMAGLRIRLVDVLMERVNVQPFFVRDAGYSAAGGEIRDVLFKRCVARGQTEGYYTFNVSGDDEVGKAGRYVPTNVRIIDCAGDKGVRMSAAAAARGGGVEGWRAL